jgi:NAD(P)-dependent dehydrogenase (short-subunit alcohol dehydrogenase family)
MTMEGLTGKVAIVTGGTSGIGRATALSFARHGAKVIITGRRVAPLREAMADHPNIAGCTADVSVPADAWRTIDETLNAWGRVDILVNNAGAGAMLPMAEATAEKITNIFAVNVLGPSLISAAALPYLAASRGAIVNVSSTLGRKAAAGLSHYAASKAALDQLTRCWALELAPLGVRVNAVAAGPTESGALTGMMGLSPEEAEAVKERERDQIPLKRRGNPEEVARWIVSLADAASDWVTGQVMTIDGGLGIT